MNVPLPGSIANPLSIWSVPLPRGIGVEEACEIMHDAYEKAAVGAGWETQAASRKPWSDVPEANKVTMRAAVTALLEYLYGRSE